MRRATLRRYDSSVNRPDPTHADDGGESDGIRAAREYGIDLSLTDYLLSLTPLERLERHDQALELIRAARAAGREHYGFDPRSPATPQHPGFGDGIERP